MQFKQISAVQTETHGGIKRVVVFALSEEGQLYVSQDATAGYGDKATWEEVKHPKDDK